jgi:molybdopterin molybdotransferase
MTGACMPADCDTVVPQELVERSADAASIRFAADVVAPGANRRLAGEDLARGHAALRAGRIVRASDLGLLASLGIGEVNVRRRLRVAFFSTGDELRSLGEPLDAGSVYDSNRYTLFAMLRRLNVDALDLGVVRDEPAALEAALRPRAAWRLARQISPGNCCRPSATWPSGVWRCARAGRSRLAASGPARGRAPGSRRYSSACRATRSP